VLLQDAVRFLAPSGAQVSLRYEVRYPLAVWFAQQAAAAAAGPYGMLGVGSLSSSSSGHGHHHAASAASALERGLKRFEICRVQRAGRGGRGLPASYLQADFDLISPSAAGGGVKERMLAEAEVIKVAAQVCVLAVRVADRDGCWSFVEFSAMNNSCFTVWLVVA
jgi:histidyl-tRNA synthetase